MVENARKVFGEGVVSDDFGRLVSSGKCKQIVFFYKDPERPFDTDRPRNWGSFGAELNGLKPWQRGGFRCFFGGWLVVEMLGKCFFWGSRASV